MTRRAEDPSASAGSTSDAFLERDTARLHYELCGEGKPLVLIHSSWGTMHMWDPQWEAFTRTHKVLRYDLRWHGETTHDASASYFATDDLFALVDAAGME